MGHRLALTVLATAAVVGVLGCGGANRGGVTTRTTYSVSISASCISGCGVSFHSARRHYTVKQVETAFAAQGIRLHTPTNQPIHGFVLLQGGHKPHVVAAAVRVSATKTKLPKLSHSLQLHPRNLGNAPFIFLAAPSRHYRIQRVGNVTALFDPSKTQSVRTALARLH